MLNIFEYQPLAGRHERSRRSGMIPIIVYFTLFFAIAAEPAVKWLYAGNTGTVKARITVAPRSELNMIYQQPEVKLTRDDIARGYIELPKGTKVEIRTNTKEGYMLVFEGLVWPFKAIEIKGLPNELQITSHSASVQIPYRKGKTVLELSYRFVLFESAKPGTYAWPLVLSFQPL